MLFNIASLLLLPAVLAVPSGVGSPVSRRNPEGHISMPNGRLGTALFNSQYSNNWAGAVWTEGGDTFTSVTGTFTVPNLSGPSGASASAWVGIDGDTCAGVILQTGVVFTMKDGNPVYNAWYEWYPSPASYFSGITIAAGNTVQLTVTTYSTTSGIVKIDNLTNGESASQSLTSSKPLCGQDAEWIVEDYSQSGGLVPLANFGTITFSNAEATGPNPGTYTPSGATLLNIDQNNQVLTSTWTSESSVTIQYEQSG